MDTSTPVGTDPSTTANGEDIQLTEEEEKHRNLLNQDDLPKDAKLMTLILNACGVKEYDPKIIPQLLEFMHRYTTEILNDADVYREHANRNNIELDDVRLAVQLKVNYSFIQPPPRQSIIEMARKKNSASIQPFQKKYTGAWLPGESECLTNPNYQIETKRVKKPNGLTPSTFTNAPGLHLPSSLMPQSHSNMETN